MKRFGDWLLEQLEARDMKAADLQQWGMSSAVSSNIINGKRQPAVESCRIISKALNIPLEEVYRAAGILPQKPDVDAVTDAVVNIMLTGELTTEDKKDILEYAKLRNKLASERNLTAHSKRDARRTAPT